MKAVATALVLIAGAAVVLWYGNTLNSWVLGGLIGGLAALLLSIPISLTVFSYLSRRHDERLEAEAQADAEAEMSFAQIHEYARVPVGIAREAYAVEEYIVDDESEWDEQEEDIRYQRQGRTQSPPSLLPAPRRGTYLPEVVRQQPKALLAPRGRDAAGRRQTTRRLNYPGFPGYNPTSTLSQHQLAARRTARQEALQQYDDIEVIPTNVTRRPRPQQSMNPHTEYTGQRSSRQLQPPANNSPRQRRTVDSVPPRTESRRAIPPASQDIPSQYGDRRTDTLANTYPTRSAEHTGPFVRHPHLDEQPRNPDIVTGSLKNPLVRRAPYMYEDDPLRQELAQQLDSPKVRRSSRYENIQQEGEE